MSKESEAQVIGIKEAAEILEVSTMTVRRLITRDKLHPVQVKNPVLVKQPVKLLRDEVIALKLNAATK